MSDPQLSPRDLALVDAVAQRVLELLAEQGTPPARSRLVSAGELAQLLGVSREYVYEHRDELGARAVGDGPRPRLRFDVEEAVAAATRRRTGGRSQAADAPAGAGQSTTHAGARPAATGPLLPYAGQNGAR